MEWILYKHKFWLKWSSHSMEVEFVKQFGLHYTVKSLFFIWIERIGDKRNEEKKLVST